jgi:muconolactone delta-isomerase
MMKFHVTVEYSLAVDPLKSRQPLEVLVHLAEWLEGQKGSRTCDPLHLYWAAEMPPTAYAIFDVHSEADFQEILSRLPDVPRITVRQIRDLDEVVPEGRELLEQTVS